MILIVSNERDVTTDFVVRALRQRNARFIRLNTDAFLRSWRTSWTLNGWRADGPLARSIISSEVSAVYYRRPRPPHPIDGTSLDAGAFASREGATLLRCLLRHLDAAWISEPEAIQAAENKLHQLTVASRLGFMLPESLVTNDPAEARTFIDAFERVIVKPLSSGLLSDEPAQIAYTTLLEKTVDLGPVASAPHFFQRCIDKIADIRVTVVDDAIFACRIYSQDRADTRIDWRVSASSRTRLPHELFRLPDEVERLCVTLVKTLGLRFGAIDLVEHNGGYTFLEINPNGQWAWIEEETGAPISTAIAQSLANDTPTGLRP